MKTTALLLSIIFSISLLNAKDIIKDPTFKKKDKYWFLQLKSEYRGLKSEYKKGSISLTTTHTSENYYVSLVTEAPVKEGRIYQLRFKFKGSGQGHVYVGERSYPNIFKGKKFQADDKLLNLGLFQKFEPTSEWQEANCIFKAEKNPASHLIESLIFMLGEYQGEVTISDLSFVELKGSTASPKVKRGDMEITKAK
ncbi:hypothetical protein PQO03_16495 [Lentisphaera profundi]|uniref:CBM-cenC domain-containing protein n=1 Tax=Lentisphaera profundi TaxID=1658616 RepID=A0ABY7VYT4_9BACT|nr:hypothetical protein [Lentisphaera profundi]WDE99438.1 hypothetical protein PQO03_16495 [Lentisphaera profundi]